MVVVPRTERRSTRRAPRGARDRGRLSEFVAELRARVAPVSAAMMLGALVRMLSALEPNRDWGPLARVYNHLRQTVAPSRNKLSCLVRASDLFELGLRLMDTCEDGPDRPAYVATRYRDGLLVSLLIACPIRIENPGEPGDRPAPGVGRLRLLA
jgi:integrase/recombinase XerD